MTRRATAPADPSALPTLLERSDALPLVDLWVVCETGAMHDPDGREGALHLALRTLRRGTRSRSAREIDAAIDRLGAELSTSVDATTATIHAAVIRRNLPALLDLLAELLGEPTFPAAEFAQVAREVRADLIDSRDDDRTLAGRWFRRTLFAGHPFGRPASGTPRTLTALGRDHAVRTWKHTAVGTNVLLAAAGDITEEELLAFRDRILPRLPGGAAPAREVDAPRPLRGRRLVLVDKPARSQTQIYIGNLGTHPRDRDHHALVLGNTIFGGTFTARLMREIRSKRGWSYGASSRLGRDRAREAWSMWTFPAAADAPACIRLQLELLRKLLDEGVTERELNFARSFLVRGQAFEVDTPTKRLWQRLDRRLLSLPANFHDRYVERLQAVTRDEVNDALRRRLSADDLLVSVVATASELRAPLEKAIPDLASTLVVPYETD